eukprot:scaffold36680_cov69-Phaeocystis_antarctica.AAC.1
MPTTKLMPEMKRTISHHPRLSSDILRARRCVLTSDVRSSLSQPLDGAAAAAERRCDSRGDWHRKEERKRHDDPHGPICVKEEGRLIIRAHLFGCGRRKLHCHGRLHLIGRAQLHHVLHSRQLPCIAEQHNGGHEHHERGPEEATARPEAAPLTHNARHANQVNVADDERAAFGNHEQSEVDPGTHVKISSLVLCRPHHQEHGQAAQQRADA